MNDSTNKELAQSLLATAGSLHSLEVELDRLSLHSLPVNEDESSWLSATVSDSPSSTGSVMRSKERRRSRSSSKFDSAISSLHSQTDHTTDEEAGRETRRHSHKSKRKERATFSQADWDWLYHTQSGQVSSERHASKRRHKVKHKRSDKDHSITSSPTSTPTPHSKATRHSHSTVHQSTPWVPTLDYLRRQGSIQSLSSTDSFDSSGSSKRSFRVLSIGLSQEDILQIASLPSERPTARVRRTNSTVSNVTPPQKLHAEVVYITPPADQEERKGGHDSLTLPPDREEREGGYDSDSSTSTVVGEPQQTIGTVRPDPPAEVTPPSTTRTLEVVATPPTPEIVVISAAEDEETMTVTTPTERPVSINSKLPRRYSRDTADWLKPPTHSAKKTNSPKRSASFLQRLKLRRGTSFKVESKAKKRVPVRRSLSDRIMYQIRKGLVDYKEDMDFISNPSHLRRIGRMVDRQAGRFHLVQLHRPPNGRYGIYITESAFRRGIFVSRFADASTAKFYSGLMSPGDEIVKINKERVQEKSVDYVYDRLAKMDSVVFTILPVNSRPDW